MRVLIERMIKMCGKNNPPTTPECSPPKPVGINQNQIKEGITMIKLGQKVRDNITGLTGIAVGKTEWLFGCNRLAIEPQELKDGKPIDLQWFDEQRVELVEDKPIKVSEHNVATSGGPQNDPIR